MYKQGSRKKLCQMKNRKMKHKQTEMKYLRSVHPFHTKLCSSTLKEQHSKQKNTGPDTPETQQIMTPEVKRTLKELKNKALGIHN